MDSKKIGKVIAKRRKEKGMTKEQAKDLLLNDYMYFACMLVKNNQADGVVSGACHSTANTLRPALQIIKTKKGCKLVSAFFLMSVPNCTYGSNGTYDIDSDITLYAVWKINTTGDYVVTFDTGYGIITMNVDKDAIIDSIVDPVRDGYTFVGWYADKEYKNKYDFNTKITSDLTLYAKWEKNEKTDDELDENIKTGDVMMFIAWTIGIGALAYGVYYYKTRMED